METDGRSWLIKMGGRDGKEFQDRARRNDEEFLCGNQVNLGRVHFGKGIAERKVRSITTAK
jgi:hypothetical protein